MPPSNRAADEAVAVARRRGDDPPGHGVDGGAGDVDLGLEVPDGSPSPLDGKRLRPVGILVSRLPCPDFRLTLWLWKS